MIYTGRREESRELFGEKPVSRFASRLRHPRQGLKLCIEAVSTWQYSSFP